jgi:hypothetical protein
MVDGYEVTVAITDKTYYLYKRSQVTLKDGSHTDIYFFVTASPKNKQYDWEPFVMPYGSEVKETASQHVPVLKLRS